MKRYIKSNSHVLHNYLDEVYETSKEAIAFAEEHKDEVISYINDTTDLLEYDFQYACIDRMIELLEAQDLYVSDTVRSYLVDMFDGYGFA